MTKKYTVLHSHSEYSLMRGLPSCGDIKERITEIGSSACAITDHNGVSGCMDFDHEMREGEIKIKPILGSKFSICRDKVTRQVSTNRALDHQIILAKNLAGWKDLLKLTSVANQKEHYYCKPRLDMESIVEYANKGNLISFSGHLGSTLANEISCDGELVDNWKNMGMRKALELQSMFGKGNFFIEIQLIDRGNEKMETMAGCMRDIAATTGIPVVATPASRYCRQEDAGDQRVLLCTSYKTSLPEVSHELKTGEANDTLSTFFGSDNYHIPTYEEMAELHTPEELGNTNLIADMCEDYSVTNPLDPPKFKCPDGMSPEDYLRKSCGIGWVEKMGHVKKGTELFKEYGDRVNEELGTFGPIGLSSYFLIVNDIIDFVKSRGYLTGVGRGSSSGCMISNLLGITQVDPIPYDLMLSRFYNTGRNTPGKISWPDIDFDIPKRARDEAIEHVRTKYGEDKVAQIITFQTLAGKAALTRVMQSRGNIDFAEQKALTKHIEDTSKIADELKGIEDEYGVSSPIMWALENKRGKLKEWCYIGKDGKLEGRFAKIFEQAIRLEGTKIISGRHAAGVVVSNNPISDVAPMVLDNKGKIYLAGLEGPWCEAAGLLKLDCLGLRTLDKTMDAVKIVGGE